MGIVLDDLCCIDTNSIFDQEHSNYSLKENLYFTNTFETNPKDSHRTIPSSEIKLFNPYDKEDIKIKRLSKIPISTLNVIRKHSGDVTDCYEIMKKLGGGSYGTVFQVKHKISNKIRSMKVISKNNLKQGYTDEDLITEVNILKKLDHPHILKIYEFFIDKDNAYLINEYCSEGDLGAQMLKVGIFSEDIVKVLMVQIFSAVRYLNEKGVIHGDMKPENIMIDSCLDYNDNIINNNNNEYDKIKGSITSDKSFVASLLEDTKEMLEYNTSSVNNEKKKKSVDHRLEGFFSELKKYKNKNSTVEDKIEEECKDNLDNEINSSKRQSKSTYNKNIRNELALKNKLKSNLCKDRRSGSSKFKNLKLKNFELKLIDFGCSKIFTPFRKVFEDTVGTLIYCSPEVLRNNYNEKCDIWSCGIIMYALLTGEFPYSNTSDEEITAEILAGKYHFNENKMKNISRQARDLIEKCLIFDKNKRISAKDALTHEFFSDDINPNNLFGDDVECRDTLNILKLNYGKSNIKHNKLYQIVLAYLAHNYVDKKELENLKKIFYKIDLNLDGKISKEELYYAYKQAKLDIQKEQLQKIIDSIDFDKNGYIEFEEFIRATIPKDKLFTENNLKLAFNFFDLDKNGTISLNEIKDVLGIGNTLDDNVSIDLLKEIKNDDFKFKMKESKEFYESNKEDEIDFEQFKRIIIDCVCQEDPLSFNKRGSLAFRYKGKCSANIFLPEDISDDDSFEKAISDDERKK